MASPPVQKTLDGRKSLYGNLYHSDTMGALSLTLQALMVPVLRKWCGLSASLPQSCPGETCPWCHCVRRWQSVVGLAPFKCLQSTPPASQAIMMRLSKLLPEFIAHNNRSVTVSPPSCHCMRKVEFLFGLVSCFVACCWFVSVGCVLLPFSYLEIHLNPAEADLCTSCMYGGSTRAKKVHLSFQAPLCRRFCTLCATQKFILCGRIQSRLS